jgi:hypothetical protein
MYAEMSFFDGYHFQHIADYHEHLRLKRLHTQACRAMQRVRIARLKRS